MAIISATEYENEIIARRNARDGVWYGSDGESGSRNGNSIWNKVLDNAASWINSISSGISNIVMAKTGNYPTVQEDNTPKVLAISAVAAVVLIIIIVIIFKK